MKIKTTRDALLAAVGAVRSAANQKSSIPILSNVLIGSSGDRVQVSATDMHITKTAVIEGAEADSGSIAVGALALFDVAKNAAKGPITMELKDGVMAVKAGRSRFKLPTMPGDGYPELPTRDGEFVAVDHDKLGAILSAVHYAAGTDTTRHNLLGVHLRADDGALVAEAADGSRGSQASTSLDLGAFDVFVPTGGVAELRGALSDGMEVAVGAALMFVRTDAVTIAIRLGENEFPPMSKLVDQSLGRAVNKCVVNRTMFLDALRRVDMFASGKDASAVRADLTEGSLSLSGVSHDVGEGVDTIDTDYAGEPLRVSFTPRFLVDILTAVSDDDVSLRVGGPLDAVVVESSAGCDFVGLVMPIRERGE